jgi:hypothetical protein
MQRGYYKTAQMLRMERKMKISLGWSYSCALGREAKSKIFIPECHSSLDSFDGSAPKIWGFVLAVRCRVAPL